MDHGRIHGMATRSHPLLYPDMAPPAAVTSTIHSSSSASTLSPASTSPPNFSLPRRTPSLGHTHPTRADARPGRHRKISPTSATDPFSSSPYLLQGSSVPTLTRTTTLPSHASASRFPTSSSSSSFLTPSMRPSDPSSPLFQGLTKAPSRSVAASTAPSPSGLAAPLSYGSPTSSSSRPMAWGTEEPSLARRGSGRARDSALSVKTNGLALAPAGHIGARPSAPRVAAKGVSRRPPSATPPAADAIVTAADPTPSAPTVVAPPPSPPRKSSKSHKLTPKQLAKRKAEEANRRDREADERAAALAAAAAAASGSEGHRSTDQIKSAQNLASATGPLQGAEALHPPPLAKPRKLHHAQASSNKAVPTTSNSPRSTLAAGSASPAALLTTEMSGSAHRDSAQEQELGNLPQQEESRGPLGAPVGANGTSGPSERSPGLLPPPPPRIILMNDARAREEERRARLAMQRQEEQVRRLRGEGQGARGAEVEANKDKVVVEGEGEKHTRRPPVSAPALREATTQKAAPLSASPQQRPSRPSGRLQQTVVQGGRDKEKEKERKDAGCCDGCSIM